MLKCGPCNSDESWLHSLHEAFNDQCSNWDSSKVCVWIKRSQRSFVLSVGMNLPYHHDLQNYFCICSRFQSKPRQTEAFHSNRQWQCLREKELYVRPEKSQFQPQIHYLETTRPSAFKVRISSVLEGLLPAVNVSRGVLRY